MSKFDFIVDSIKFSYSSVSSYETCPYGFKLSYIQALERKGNFFSDFGTLCHKVLEEFFLGHLDYFELSKFYKDNYNDYVVSSPPGFMKNAREDYYEKGLAYFDNFYFDKELYDILLIEDPIDIKLGNVSFVAKPDLVLHEKSTGINRLIDFKTANPMKSGKFDKAKMEGYLKQFNLYVWSLFAGKGIEIQEIETWFIIANMVVKTPVNLGYVQDNLNWFTDTIEKIKKEEDFLPNNKNTFFCQQLCSVSDSCIFKP
jgi:hypothetical protein